MMRIMEIIGGDAALYGMFTDLIRIVFKATPYPSLCSLRVDLLMNFHDQDVTQVTTGFLTRGLGVPEKANA